MTAGWALALVALGAAVRWGGVLLERRADEERAEERSRRFGAPPSNVRVRRNPFDQDRDRG